MIAHAVGVFAADGFLGAEAVALNLLFLGGHAGINDRLFFSYRCHVVTLPSRAVGAVARAPVIGVNALVALEQTKNSIIRIVLKMAVFPSIENKLLGRFAKSRIDEMRHDLRDDPDEFVFLVIGNINIRNALAISFHLFRREQ
ncbi:hypothetical protein [Altericroceibacterium spongiae]|uniref:hypothetical protein n=1 Tax=Altericroceibacterium spongiae TaxID=2320269 RepID=UPI0011C44479|nr:hypothetical protein [Altericroceibacterium spongiae]